MKEEDAQNLINMALQCTVSSLVPLAQEQLDALQNLHEYCVHLALKNPEVAKHPLKIVYKTNEEFKMALVSFCLAYSLTNPLRKLVEDKDFFEKNITVYHQHNNVKEIDFGEIEQQTVVGAINWEIVEDWKLYRDSERDGIRALVEEKTDMLGLEDYKRGGNPMYEFARFHRKFVEKEKRAEHKNKQEMQNAYRTAVISSVTSEVAKQQLLEGKNPVDIINALLKQSDDLDIKKSDKTPRIEDKTDK